MVIQVSCNTLKIYAGKLKTAESYKISYKIKKSELKVLVLQETELFNQTSSNDFLQGLAVICNIQYLFSFLSTSVIQERADLSLNACPKIIFMCIIFVSNITDLFFNTHIFLFFNLFLFIFFS